LRVRIIFNLKNKGAIVPFHHQHMLTEFVNSVLETGRNPHFLNFPYYNFSGLKGQTHVNKAGLQFYSSKITLVFASSSVPFINYFLSLLFERQSITLGNLILSPESVEKEETPGFSESVKYICISPLVLLDPFINDSDPKKFISPITDDYSDILYDVIMNRMEKSGNYTPEQISSFYKFQIVPDKGYLEKIKSEEKKFARIYAIYEDNEMYEIRGYTLPFTLYAAPEVQQFIFLCGLGTLTNKGFGMIDLANTDPSSRTVAYNNFATAN
jgi:CRISPR-associated endoribonuclease Cas6